MEEEFDSFVMITEKNGDYTVYSSMCPSNLEDILYMLEIGKDIVEDPDGSNFVTREGITKEKSSRKKLHPAVKNRIKQHFGRSA